MARKISLVCDNCGKDVDGNEGSTILVVPFDSRKQPKQAEFCQSCSDGLPTQRVTSRATNG